MPFFSGPLQYARAYFKIEKLLNGITNGCDAAILRLPSTIAQKVCSQVMKSGIPYATELVFDANDAMQSASNPFERLLWRMINRQMVNVCNHANGVACVTEHYLQKHYTSLKPDAFYGHYSSLALDKSFYSNARSYPDGKVLSIAHVSKQVQFNGRKGYNEVIEAVGKLKNRSVNVIVNFAGPDYHDGIRKLSEFAQRLGVGDRVNFIGGVSREQLSDYLEKSDIYVMPTWAEGLPRVIIEAMAKGLPCITTPVSGNPELVDEHFLVPYYDTDILADRIEELIKDPALYEQTSRVNYERSKKYEASILQTRRDEFYTKLKNRINRYE
jgi:glycosyltransferase involved in cell wall biosynthesis